MYTCGGCKEEIKRLRVKCPKCKNNFHQTCVNFQSSKSLPTSRIAEGWSCPDCTANTKRGGDNSSTPIKPVQTVDANPPSETEEDGQTSQNEDDNLTAQMEIQKNAIVSALKLELPSLIRRQLNIELSPVRDQLKELQNSVTFLSNRYDELEKNINTIMIVNQRHDDEIKTTRENVDKLNEKIQLIEQQLRESNIEIKGVQESKSENLCTMVKQIASTVEANLDDNDILKVTRVAKFNKDNKNPRAIVAKLRSPRCRDEFLSAVARYNKSNQNNKLNTGSIGAVGKASPIYISEHLSPHNKALHAASRLKAREMKYKFVWVRDGRIYVRKDENSRYILIKDTLSLEKIV